ncbi:MAG: helix-turn-helix transcriptional regulator [Pseudomonadota bacterium]
MNQSNPIDERIAEHVTSRGETIAVRAGARLRAVRGVRKLSRKALAEQSGVSLRYIAQIEAGQGNASLLILDRLCAALGLSVAEVVTMEDEMTELMVSYRSADAASRAAARTALGMAASTRGKAKRIALIGLRGAGKSTLGARLAREIDAPFVELNDEIAALSGMNVPDLIALYGQEGYRRLEAQALGRIAAAGDRVVLAVAGGIVGAPETFETLLAHFHAIWLKASPEEHMTRVRAQGDERPMAGSASAMDELKSILTAREALYSRAPLHLDTSGRSLADAFDALNRLVAAEIR